MTAPTTLAILAVTLGIGAVGCSSPPDLAPSPGLADPYPAPENDPQVTVLSPELQPWLGFQPPLITDEPFYPMEVEVPVRNLADRRYLVDYRFLFYDDQGFELEPVMGWRMQPLYPKQTARLKAAAFDTDAVTYRLELKWSK